MTGDFQNSNSVSASLDDAQNLKFEREDWTLFRTIDGLTQKAGVSRDKLHPPRPQGDGRQRPRCRSPSWSQRRSRLPTKGGYFVDDDGPGIDGTPEEIARLFSIRRPLVSSKLLRLPTRGAVGNGLRVVAGAVLAIRRQPRRHHPQPAHRASPRARRQHHRRQRQDGQASGRHPHRDQLRPRTAECDDDTLDWAQARLLIWRMSGRAIRGKTSPWWYDAPQFHELLDASGDRPVRDLVAQLDGCTGAKAGEIVAAAGLNRAICKDVTRPQAERLLRAARASMPSQVNPKRLGAVGPDAFPMVPMPACTVSATMRRSPTSPSWSKPGPKPWRMTTTPTCRSTSTARR